MMKKVLVILGIIILTAGLTAETVAVVGQSSISSEQLYSEIKNYSESDSLSFLEIKKIALNKLIEDQLILNYALESSITVDNLELESYFIQELGGMPRFRSNGDFDYYKFGKFKNTGTGKKILGQMERELLLNKTRILVMKKYELADEALLEEFIMDNTEIGLNYAILDIDDISIPTYLDAVGADRFYQQYQNRYRYQEKAKFSFYYFPFEKYSTEARIRAAAAVEEYMLADSTYTLAQLDSISIVMADEETKKITLNRTMETYRFLNAEMNLEDDRYETPYLGYDEEFGIFSSEIVELGFALEQGEISEPVLLDSGYLILVLDDVKRDEIADSRDVAGAVWDDYIARFREKSLKGGMQEYFSQHFDEFVGRAAYVNLVTIPSHRYGIIPQKNENTIKLALQEAGNNIDKISEIADDYNLKSSKEIIYLEKYSNASKLNDLVKYDLEKGEDIGFIRYDDDLVYYCADTFFPEFIPEMDKIKEELVRKSVVSTVDTTGFFDFYRERSADFTTPDSLQIGGAFITIKPDSVKLSEEQMADYYNQHLENLNRDKSVNYSYFYIKDYDQLALVTNYLLLNRDWQDLRSLYGELYNDHFELPQNEIIAYDQLPRLLKTALLQTAEGKHTPFIEFNKGWISLHKNRDYPAGNIEFYEAQQEISVILKQQLADEMAQTRARAIFDSTSLFGNVYKYASSEEIFKTELLPADSVFPKIGELGSNKAELMRKWRNEKLNKIVKADSGYAVVFQLKRKSSKQQSFEDVLPKLVNIFTADEIMDSANAYAGYLQDQIKNGANADSLLFYLGGWASADNLTLESEIFGRELSRLILEDITKHDEGYHSNIIRIKDDQLMFYYINYLRKIPRSEFYKNKSLYRKKNIERKFNIFFPI